MRSPDRKPRGDRDSQGNTVIPSQSTIYVRKTNNMYTCFKHLEVPKQEGWKIHLQGVGGAGGGESVGRVFAWQAGSPVWSPALHKQACTCMPVILVLGSWK